MEGSGLFYFQSLSDDQAGAGFKNWKYVNVPSEDANWTSTYDEIRHANEMINSLNTMASEMDPETKNHWLGVCSIDAWLAALRPLCASMEIACGPTMCSPLKTHCCIQLAPTVMK